MQLTRHVVLSCRCREPQVPVFVFTDMNNLRDIAGGPRS